MTNPEGAEAGGGAQAVGEDKRDCGRNANFWRLFVFLQPLKRILLRDLLRFFSTAKI